MRINKSVSYDPVLTAEEGAKAVRITPELELRRSVMACMLWEDSFYESGESIASRIISLIPKVKPAAVADIAREARNQSKLRHVPLLLARELARGDKTAKALVSDLLFDIIQRADELSEFVAVYWKDKKQPLSKQVKLGLARAFTKFSEYDLAKYNRDAAVKLRDVLFLCHAKPKNKEQGKLWKRLAEGKLEVPDTWEVALSASKGEEKKAIWERLLTEKKLGALALLRNLRNMEEVKVERTSIREAIVDMRTERVLPFRFISAARYAPFFEPSLEVAMLKCLGEHDKLNGHTVLLVDNSGSMDGRISGKSEITRRDAACGVAMLLREICDSVEIIVFGTTAGYVAARRGFALRDLITASEHHGGTDTARAKELADTHEYDRIIIITDEQSHTNINNPKSEKAYVVNVAAEKNGIGYGKWTHIDGWSESVVDFIRQYEKMQ